MAKKRVNANNKKVKKKSFGRILFKGLTTVILITFFLSAITLTYFYLYTKRVNDNNFWASKNTTHILDRDENLINVYGQNIEYVELDDISQYYLDALIATEDSEFYNHRGVDFKGMARAFYQTFFTEESSGGSTLTMQLAKELFLSPKPKVDKEGNLLFNEDGTIQQQYPYKNKIGYKIQQIIYAWKIETKYSKEEILENYVNLINFGGTQGIQNASQYYFGVNADNLTLSQGAMLAGLTQAPFGDNNPYENLEQSTKRRNVVLKRMYDEEYITKEEYEDAKEDKIEDTLLDQNENNSLEKYEISRAYVDVVELELKELFGQDFDLSTANMTVYTSLDSSLQEETYKTINNHYGNIGYLDDVLQAGSATIDSQNGEVLAIGGGRKQDSPTQKNYGALYQRQPGSTSKPIVDYGPAIEYLNWSTSHQLVDQPVNYTGGPAVENAYRTYYGPMSIQQGLSISSNTIALQTFQQTRDAVGLDPIISFVEGLGITDVDPKTFNEAYSIGGWDHGTTPLELSGAYAAFANGGTYNKPHTIRRIEISKASPYYEDFGESYEYEYESHKAMLDSTAYMVSMMLNPKLSYSISKELYVDGLGEQSVKTGTSNWAENSYGIPEGGPRDKWVAGYNADVTTVIWTGYDGEAEEKGYYFNDYGLWSYDLYVNIMKIIVNDPSEYLHDNKFEKPDDVYSRVIGADTYYYKSDSPEFNDVIKAEQEEKERLEEERKAEREAEEKRAEEEAEREAQKEAEEEAKKEEEKEQEIIKPETIE